MTVVAGALALAGASLAGTATAAPAPEPAPIKLGDLNPAPTGDEVGAPFDVCGPQMWDGALPQVQPAERDPGRKVPVEPGIAMCAFENDGPIKLKMDMESGQSSATAGGRMALYVAWGEQLGPLEGGQPAQFAGADGVGLRDTNDQGDARCNTRVHLSHGTAGVIALNSRFPDVDVCDLATAMSEHIATIAR